ncbi:MAG: ABC transporter ATP-binding protein [Cloacibacillus sp.]
MTLEVLSLFAGYGGKTVIEDISFKLSAGSVLCLLGPNGAGKSTLIKCLAGTAAPLRGEIKIDGKAPREMGRREFAKIVAYIPQSSGPVFPFKVRDMAAMGRTPHKGFFDQPNPKDYARVSEALAQLGLSHLEEKNFTELSGGERQMALFAAALVQEPQILLLDEPTSHLDFGNQIKVLKTVRRLADERGISVLMATHSPEHALFIGDAAAIVRDGKMWPPGAPDEIITEKSISECFAAKVRVIETQDGQKVCFPDKTGLESW